MVVDHIGYVVKNIETAKISWIQKYGYHLIKDIVYDRYQHVNLCLLQSDNEVNLELIQPIDATSPSYDFMRKGGGLHHFCYQVEDLESSIKAFKNKKCLLLKKPKPAILFENQQVAFFFDVLQKQVFEIIESSNPAVDP